MTADYSQWRRWLRGEDTRNYVRGLHPGFYRAKYGAADEWFPLAVFAIENELYGLFLNQILTDDELQEMRVWPQAARHPIEESVYRAVAEQGQPWPPKPRNKAP